MFVRLAKMSGNYVFGRRDCASEEAKALRQIRPALVAAHSFGSSCLSVAMSTAVIFEGIQSSGSLRKEAHEEIDGDDLLCCAAWIDGRSTESGSGKRQRAGVVTYEPELHIDE